MKSFAEAFDIVMNSARQLGTARVELGLALNRVLAEDVASDMDMPPFNKSQMDGFACRRADLPNELTIIETIPAGALPEKRLGKNQCAKIMTGAPVPEGADCVIMVEHTESLAHNRIRFVGEDADSYICPKGQDVKEGDVILRAGVLIKAQHIAVLASFGCTRPLVSLQPRVGVIATGDELVEPDRRPTACQIRNSNSFQLAAQAADSSAIPTNYGIAADTQQGIESAIRKAMAENDVVIISGGVSVGDYDLVRGILKEIGVRLLFERVAVKPGRPTVFGVSDKAFCFGLPGNPVSNFVMFELLIKSFLYKMMGHDYRPVFSRGQLEATIKKNKSERDSWLPVVFTRNGKIAAIDYHGSAHINALCEADGLLCVPAGVAQIKEGTTVAVRQI
jgi:molybdopterin molybdotransferase